MAKKIKIILNTLNNSVYDVEITGKEKNDKVFKFNYFFDGTHFEIIEFIHYFDDKITGDELAKLLVEPYPSVKKKLKQLNHIVKINKKNYPNTYTFQDDVEVVSFSEYMNNKLKNWSDYKKELEEKRDYSKKQEDENRKVGLFALTEYKKKLFEKNKRHKPKWSQIEELEAQK